MRTIKWQPISRALKDVYHEHNILEYFENDESYLKNAFKTTERLWQEQFNKTDTLNIIMISEAPLFGDIQRYIYNPDTPPSVFFYFKDLEVFLEEGQKIKRPKTTQEQKNIMFEYFSNNGFISLDIFPFALNPHHTKIHYQNMSKKLYHHLLKITAENYLIPKLKLCLEKSTEHTHFVYRYKRLFDKTEHHFEEVLKQISEKEIKYKIDSINSKSMSLDKEKLKRLLSA